MSDALPWNPAAKPPGDGRLVLIANKAWEVKPWAGAYKDGQWYDVQDGAKYDAKSDHPNNQPPTHWKEIGPAPAEFEETEEDEAGE